MRKKLAIVFALTNENKKDHVIRLVKMYHVIAIVPEAMRSPWLLELVGRGNHYTVPYPYTDISAAVGVTKFEQWEKENGRIHGIMPLTDTSVEYTAMLIERINITRVGDPLRGTALDTAITCRNKCKFRTFVQSFTKRIKSLSLKSLNDVERAKHDGMCFPAILKPARGMGSMYVRKIERFDQLYETFKELQSAKMPEDWAQAGFILEEFFDGEEVDVDGWVRDGRLEFAVVKNEIPTGPPDFCERGGYYPSQLSSRKNEALLEMTERVVNAFGDIHGAFHFEAVINNDMEVFAIELNVRVGGAEAAYAVEATTGYHLHSAHAQLAVGDLVTRHNKIRYESVFARNLYLDVEMDLLGIRPVDEDTCEKLDVVVVKYFGTPRHYVPNRGCASCVCWLAVGGKNMEDAEGKASIIENLIEYEYTVTP